MLAMLGCVVGTGNIWRFPRILASHAEEGGTRGCCYAVQQYGCPAFVMLFPCQSSSNAGALVFLMVWFGFLWLWSIPIILIEYGVGRFTHKSVVESFNQLLGPAFRWMGGFLAVIALLIGLVMYPAKNKSLHISSFLFLHHRSYYSVLLGYCVYYVIFFMAKELPESLEEAEGHFDDLQVTLSVL